MRHALPALALALSACTTPASQAGPPAEERPVEGGGLNYAGAAPAVGQDFKLVLRGYPGPGDVNLGAQPGKVLLVDFWATWCGPCHEAATAYQGLYDRYKDKGLEVYGVSVDEDPNQIGAFLAQQGVHYPIVVDPAAAVSGPRFSIDSIPTVLVVDRRGKLRSTHKGYDPAELPQLTAELEALLAEK